ncbi:hypothetical protein ALC53_08108 [Atta colombica]|uniref:THAP-type domain-containing protein n=1 Tax=Atta colombica TaxID=520822 RepID=A0A195BAU4_9HYME|nr:hypothetical protein ALC53_08108 [Atta colombica]
MLVQKLSCAVKECNKNIVENQHLFPFPMKHNRWLQWTRACGRSDLEEMGLEYYIFDTPHLMKKTRDNLLKYDIEFGNKVTS